MPARKSRRERQPSEHGPTRQRSDANRRNLSIGKAAALLRAATRYPDGTSISQLARDARIPRATALRMVTALHAEGFLMRFDEQDRVMLGTGLLELAAAVRPEQVLVEASREHLAALADATDETVTLAVRHGDEIIGIDEIRAGHVIGPSTWVGRSWPLEGTASGRIARGVVGSTEIAESVDELEVGLASIAGRIPASGGTDAYITVSGPTFRFGATERAAAAPHLLAAAAAIAHRIQPGQTSTNAVEARAKS